MGGVGGKENVSKTRVEDRKRWMKSGKFRWLRRIPSAPQQHISNVARDVPICSDSLIVAGRLYQDVHLVLSETVTCQAMPRKVIASVDNPAATSSTNEIEVIAA